MRQRVRSRAGWIAVFATIAIVPPATGQEDVPSVSSFSLAGQIVDDFNGAPVVSAVVKVAQLKRYVFSDLRGRFHFPEFPEGTWDIVVEMLGYHTLEGSVTLAEGNGLLLRLKPDPVLLEGLRVRTRSELLLEKRRRRYPFRITTISAEIIADAINPDPAAIFRRNANAPIMSCPTRVDPWMSLGGCMWKRGSARRIIVYLDELALPGGMNELSMLHHEEIHSMDWLPNNVALRVYTKRFIDRVNSSGTRLAPFPWGPG